MKKLEIFLVTFLLLGMFACDGNSNNGQNLESTNEKSDTLNLKTETLNLGKIKMDEDGHSMGKKTELTELYRLLQKKEFDIIKINWIWDTDPVYDDMPMQIRYDKLKSELILIYLKNNVKEEYSDVYPDCLSDYLKDGKKGFYSLEGYCTNSKYDFNNREMTN